MKFILDSGVNHPNFEGIDYEIVPLTISSESKDYIDDKNLNVMKMVNELKKENKPTHTACPSQGAYLEAIGDNNEAIIITISKNVSGSYNSALLASNMITEEDSNKKIYVLDSVGIGPSQVLVTNKVINLLKENENKNDNDKKDMNEILKDANEYAKNNVKIGFALKSLKNLANNGRINKAAAAIAGALNISVVGIFDGKELLPTAKCRGEQKTITNILLNLYKDGYNGGKMIIDHCNGLNEATRLKEEILTKYPNADIKIGTTSGLCSYYVEDGGIIYSYEVLKD